MNWQGHLIKTKADALKIPITKLAKQLGVSRQAVNDWIKGQIPKGMHIISLCKILGLKPDELFGVNEDKSIVPKPLYRKRGTAKENEETNQLALELAEEYKMLFKNCNLPHFVPVERSGERSVEAAKIIAKKLREQSGVQSDNPMTYEQAFQLLDNLGIFVIFREFPTAVKCYAFYTKINDHRIIFVNKSDNILDVIFQLLHESVHALRDELNIPVDRYAEEDTFCDLVASYAQFPQNYIEKIYQSIRDIKTKSQLLKSLRSFGSINGHVTYGVVKRILEIDKNLKINVGDAAKTDHLLRKQYPTLIDIFNDAKTARDYIDLYKELSPNFITLLSLNMENISERKLGEYLELSNPSDIREIKEELAYKVKELALN
ncbi:MAG: helix-turn-helix domain-containing protein [bacterium]